MDIPKILKDEIWEFCRINDITDINNFMIELLRQGFTIEKYGNTPVGPQIIEKEIIKEVEKIIEVPVEIIKEVIVEREIIKEVPVEVIKEVFIENGGEKIENIVEVIKEVIIEKEVSNTDELIKLQSEVKNLKSELEIEKTRNQYSSNQRRNQEEPPKNTTPGNVISWASKEERNKKDLYGE